MEQIVSMIREQMQAEADAGYPLLRRIPSTQAIACFDYLENLLGPLAMGLRYQSIRMAKAVLNDAQSVAMMRQTRSTLGYVPRDDAPVPLVNDPDVTKLHPAKAPQLKKLVKPLLQGVLGTKEDKMPGGTIKYDGALDGTLVKVRVDYAARDVQMIYTVSIPDPERKVPKRTPRRPSARASPSTRRLSHQPPVRARQPSNAAPAYRSLL